MKKIEKFLYKRFSKREPTTATTKDGQLTKTETTSSIILPPSDKKESNHPFTIAIEGNIASGKTSLLKQFQKEEDIYLLDEPLAKWKNLNGTNLLELMYGNPTKWGMLFQSYVQLTLLENHKLPLPEGKKIKIMERSIFSARYCFIRSLEKDKLLNDAEINVLDKWFNWILNNHVIQVDLFIYLRTKPEVASARMNNRNRREEKAVSMEYLNQIQAFHDDWLIRQKPFPCPAPVLILDADRGITTIDESFHECKRVIKQMITKNAT